MKIITEWPFVINLQQWPRLELYSATVFNWNGNNGVTEKGSKAITQKAPGSASGKGKGAPWGL